MIGWTAMHANMEDRMNEARRGCCLIVYSILVQGSKISWTQAQCMEIGG